ncbi:hypothetical protein [Pseudomonas xionganensis]|uniref:Uncharacterized protein n=1 Tax=Pseudomonas xionganensis TaxID=2654845 RepID=A0A6I4KS70_9PSED|nr:hypothetical protein [Pseudomonas xionganensis]MVW75380.1 hypothetical protein [Pseudomonas xionganensis]
MSHVIARVMSIDTIDGTKKPGWQALYQAGFPEVTGSGSGLSEQERLTQDSMTRAALHRELPELAWRVLVAKYSINDIEVAQAVHWLVPRVASPGHHLFKMKCVTAWAIPRRLGPAFYQLQTWDAEGTPEGTLRRWRSVTKRWLEDQLEDAFRRSAEIMAARGLIERDAA